MAEVCPDVDPDFAEIVHRGLSRDIELRIASAREYQSAIASWGRRQGRTSFAFDVTLASDRPSAQALSAALVTASNGNAPSTKGTAKAEVVPAAASTSMPNSGTPTAWSEETPEVHPTGGDRQTLASPDAVSEASVPVADGPAPRRRLVVGALAAAALALVGVLALRGRADDRSTVSEVSAAATATTATPPAPEPKAATPAAILPAEPAVDVADAVAPVVAESASATPIAPEPANVKKNPVPGAGAATKRADTKPTATAKSTTEATPPPASPEPTAPPAAHGRKFRTNLD